MDASEKYLFDVNGYIVVPGILDSGLLERLNHAIDESDSFVIEEDYRLSNGAAAFAGDRRRTEFSDALSWPHPACEPFRELLALPAALEYLLEVLGDGFRLDSMRGTVMEPGTEGFTLHGGAGNPDNICQYRVIDGTMRTTLVNVSYALTDVEPGAGGFACIPGSHKAAFRCPSELARLEGRTDHVKQIPAKAGDAVIFTEALIHGTLPWPGPGTRRTVFIRYSPGAMSFRRDPLPDNYEQFSGELTPVQHALMEPPYYVKRPGIRDLLKQEAG